MLRLVPIFFPFQLFKEVKGAARESKEKPSKVERFAIVQQLRFIIKAQMM